jgi:hypothetical protein
LVSLFDADGVEKPLRLVDDLCLIGDGAGPDFDALSFFLRDFF